MTDEADARVRLLAHYQDRLVMLAGKLEAVEAELATDYCRKRGIAIKSQIQRYKRDVTDTREKARRLREAIGSPPDA